MSKILLLSLLLVGNMTPQSSYQGLEGQAWNQGNLYYIYYDVFPISLGTARPIRYDFEYDDNDELTATEIIEALKYNVMLYLALGEPCPINLWQKYLQWRGKP